jgi:hypothetical protein
MIQRTIVRSLLRLQPRFGNTGNSLAITVQLGVSQVLERLLGKKRVTPKNQSKKSPMKMMPMITMMVSRMKMVILVSTKNLD